ncbi:hypothetical protein [Streptomyces angustmyceticus]|uniref:hypothetical protein n=1 Tax=Streptomyces angustmyceticus TaxID=285578 RepID=UPI003D9121CB
MDTHNLCQTPTTYRLLRLEYLLGLAVAAGFFVAHLGAVRWWVAVVLFAYIDVIGYLPGAVAFRRSRDGRIHRAYYVLYNLMHSLAFQGLVVAGWIWAAGPEWALLVVPIHLCGDRGLFGNFVKSFTVPFEPAAHPAVGAALRTFATVPWYALPPSDATPSEVPSSDAGPGKPPGPRRSSGQRPSEAVR